ncbi:MAG: tRNA (guanosine(46)-N7)-methyltransferase TrmB [Phycisphaerales bacterium]
MSFGLSRGRDLDTAGIEIPAASLPPLPDDLLTRPDAGHLDIRAWFAHPERALELEIGSGKGTFLIQQAPLCPTVNYVGIEYAREFFDYAADRLRRAAVRNVRMLCTDASEFIHWRVPDACLQVLHVYFPDPWPKLRHHRRRMIQDRFLHDARRILAPAGELRVVTDHDDYWAWMEEHFRRFAAPPGERLGEPGVLFDRLPFDRAASAREGELVGSNFERKYRVEGRSFNGAVLRSRAPAPR